MYSKILIKFILLSLLLIVTSCESSHQQSFQQLESALVSWYYKYHPTSASELNISKYNHQIEKYNTESIEEYKADINRFMIELSQIDETKLKKEDLIRYLATDEFLFHKYNGLNFESHSYSVKTSIKNLYDSLFFIIHNSNLDMEQRAQFSLSRLNLFSTALSNIQKKLIYYSETDLKESLIMISAFEKLLSNLHLYINADNNTLDEIEKNILKINQSIKILKQHLANFDKENKVDQQKIINQYLSYNKNINFNLDYQFLIQEINSKMLDISLPIYTVNNDEPVWVDREDTLNIIDFILNKSLEAYPDNNETLMSLDESLVRINSFSNSISTFKNYANNYEIIINNHIYLENDMIYRIWSDNSKTYLFLDKEHYIKNNLENKFNKYELDLYNIGTYFPGKHFQKQITQKEQDKISSISINEFTNYGWGLLSQYILVDQGYGSLDNNVYMLVHLKNVLNSILKNMIFSNYYIDNKTKSEIQYHIDSFTFYDEKEIELLILEVLSNPLESNFEIIGYLKLKEIYDNFGYRKLSDFNSILIESAHLNPNLIKELKFPND